MNSRLSHIATTFSNMSSNLTLEIAVVSITTNKIFKIHKENKLVEQKLSEAEAEITKNISKIDEQSRSIKDFEMRFNNKCAIHVCKPIDVFEKELVALKWSSRRNASVFRPKGQVTKSNQMINDDELRSLNPKLMLREQLWKK